MYKEAIICIITVIGILFVNGLTENYTKQSVGELTELLSQVKEELSEDNIGSNEIKDKIGDINDRWEKIYSNFAYYLEHDELEKISKNLVVFTSLIETEEYSEAVKELDESVFSLKHIQEKNSFDLKNIF